jgi:hypothetical protein
MRTYLHRLAVTAGIVALIAAFGPVAGVSAAPASGGTPPPPALKGAEQGSGTIRFGFLQAPIDGTVGTFREQCVAGSDGRRFNAQGNTQMLVSVTRSDIAVCGRRSTQSTWYLSVASPERDKGQIIFDLAQDGPGGKYSIECRDSTGNLECTQDRESITISSR